MASQTKLKKSNSHFSLCTFLIFTVLFTIPVLFLLRSSSCSTPISPSFDTHQAPWSGDLQTAQFAWNRLSFSSNNPPPKTLKLAVFSRKWPTGPNPGGMERHAFTLYTALARRGHQVHVFTSSLDPSPETNKITPVSVSDQTLNPKIHSHGDAEPGKWRYDKAWELYQKENWKEPLPKRKLERTIRRGSFRKRSSTSLDRPGGPKPSGLVARHSTREFTIKHLPRPYP